MLYIPSSQKNAPTMPIRPEKCIQYEHMPMANEDSSIAKNHVLAMQHVGSVMAVFMVVFDSIKPRPCISLLLLGESFGKEPAQNVTNVTSEAPFGTPFLHPFRGILDRS